MCCAHLLNSQLSQGGGGMEGVQQAAPLRWCQMNTGVNVHARA